MYQEYLDFAKDIAVHAGEIMLRYYMGDNHASYKFDQSIVTRADTEINSYLIQRVKETYPTHSVDGEEESFGESNYVWVCDPVDGTAMYARHIPVSVFSLALVVDGVTVVGVVFDVFGDRLYSAVKGGGAYIDEVPMHVSDIPLDDMRSIANFDMWRDAEYNLYDVFKELGKKTYGVGLGSIIRASMCVANGEFTMAIFPGTGHKNCDIAAAKIIVEEAGGRVTDLFGNDQRYDKPIHGALITNSVVHDEVLALIKEKLEYNK